MREAKQAPNDLPAIYYGQIDTYWGVKDYQRKGLCVRAFAVEEANYNAVALEDPKGVRVITLDISYWQYCRSVLGADRWLTTANRAPVDDLERSPDDRGKWYRFAVKWEGSRRDGYAYPTYGDEEPRYFELISVTSVQASKTPYLRNPPGLSQTVLQLSPGPSRRRSSSGRPAQSRSSAAVASWHLTAFHVGQGMCSLASDGVDGVLLDIGAGIPVLRPRYLHDPTFKNELSGAVSGLRNVDLVLSHADADHWRLLSWDAGIRSKIRHIYVPTGAKQLAFQDPQVIHKTIAAGDMSFKLSATSSLNVYRSKPNPGDDNGHCLVAVFECNGKRALVAGDYVYRRYSTDTHSKIRALGSLAFDAVVVPHHGDLASRLNILPAKPGAIAFFSAGTHKKYKHPTAASRQAHKKSSYAEVCNNTCADIKGVLLI